MFLESLHGPLKRKLPSRLDVELVPDTLEDQKISSCPA